MLNRERSKDPNQFKTKIFVHQIKVFCARTWNDFGSGQTFGHAKYASLFAAHRIDLYQNVGRFRRPRLLYKSFTLVLCRLVRIVRVPVFHADPLFLSFLLIVHAQIQPPVHQTMIIEEFEPDVFRQLIEYIHTGCVTLQARTLLGTWKSVQYFLRLIYNL